MRLLPSLLLLTALACASEPPPVPVPGPVALERYAGAWLELARLPAFFQRGCVRSRAEYTPRGDGLAVVNRCLTRTGEERRSEGSASAVAGSGNARLRVRFDGFWSRFVPVPDEGNYWILALSPDYRTAIVGTGDRRYLWILARAPVSDAEYAALVETARAAGFAVDELIRSDWTER